MHEESLFAAALEMPGASERQAFLDEACAGNVRLRQRLDKLLAADVHPPDILDRTEDAAAILGDYLPEKPIAAGQVFAGRFTLRHKLGEGGMGEVWAADQIEPVQRRVALKVIRPGLASARLLARFDQERQTLALMDHPNIGKVLDAGVIDSRPYFILEIIDGVPITRHCDEARLSLRERLELFLPVCHAVQHAHQKGIIHRDLKPSNILVALFDGQPLPKVIDFGIAKTTGLRLNGAGTSTEVGAFVGTLEYMSPEQVEANDLDVDTRSDVYTLGVLLYELLTGSVPFSRVHLQSVAFAEMVRIIKEDEPQRPSMRRLALAGELDWIVMRCLEKDRSQRYETANALAMDLRRYLADEPVLAGPPSAGYRVRKFLHRNRGPVLAASLMMLTLVAGIVGTTIGLVWAVQARQAEAEFAEGERRAKLTAEKRLSQVENGIDVLGSIFEGLDPSAEEKEGRPLRAILGDRLDQAAAALEGEAVGDPLVVARLQDRLGGTYLGLGHAARAESLFTRAAATRQAELGAGHPLTLASRHNQALAFQAAGKPNEAIALFQQVRDTQVKLLAADDPALLTTLDSLAVAYWKAGKATVAVALLEKVRDARVKRHGADDPRTHSTLANLGGAYVAAGKKAEAIALFQQVLAGRVKQHGDDHPLALSSLNNLGAAYRAAFKMKAALALFEQARDVVVPKLGPYHPQTLIVLDNLAQMHRAYGKLPEAIALGEQVRERRIMVLGAHHPATLLTLDNLALAYRDGGKLDRALPLFQQAAAGIEKLAFANGSAGRIVRNLCDCHERLNQHDQAEVWRRKWLAVVKTKEGPESAAYAGELSGLGANLLQQKKHADAEPILRVCLVILQKTQPEAWRTFHTRAQLGATLLGQKKYAEAEPLLVQGYQGMNRWAKHFGNDHHGSFPKKPMTEALQRLVHLYGVWGNLEEEARWRKELKAIDAPPGKSTSQ